MKTAITFLCAIASCLVAAATPVTIGDPSFEGNSLSAGQWTNDLSPEWQETNGPDNGNGFEEYITGFASDGTDHLGMAQGHDVWQDLDVTYQANTRYTLTVAVGNRPGATQSGNLSQFHLADSMGTIFASGSLDAAADVASGSFADATPLVFETPGDPSAVGRTIRILLHAGGSGRSHFDNVRLEAEPYAQTGTAAVGGLAATGIGSTTATLNGLVSDIGNGAPSLTFYWGPVNGGTAPGSWANSVALSGTYGVGDFATSLTGLSPATGYYFTVRATNGAGSSWALPAAHFETLPQPPAVATSPATGISATGATLGANVTSTGGEAPAVTLYYGTADGGTTPGAWQGSVGAGVVSGAVGAPVAGLTPSTLYYFRAYAENGGGGTWSSSSLAFSTLNIGPPAVENRSAEGITGTTANLRGEISDTGNDPPVVTLFYGTSDGGTTPGSWTSSADCGVQNGGFTRFVSGLSPTTTYFFRWRAVNAHGTSWSPESGTFATTALIPSGVVINEIHYHPADDTVAEEFIELHNPGDTAVDISGWTISDAVTYTIPAGTTVPVRGYRVIASNPAVIQARYGITGVLGPWFGNLSSAGEKIDLRDASGTLRDRVGYGAGFPWPTGADGAGQSCELIHPGLDNDLGGSWRASYNPGSNGATFVPVSSTGWKYKKGTAEPSSPVDAWRMIAYDDAAWLSGSQALGYNSKYGNATSLSDMQYNYWSVYLRRTFTVPANQIPNTLSLRLLVDDGCIVWINGTEVARTHMSAGHVAYNAAAANHDATAWETFTLTNTSDYLVGGTNVIAIQVNNSSLGSSDLTINTELTAGSVTATSNPSPGTTNGVSALAADIPPQIRQVAHSPVSPAANQPVTITARITDPDGVGAVTLSYQTVDPGSYIRRTDPAYSTSWTTVAMTDNGTNGDAVAGDSVYSAVLPEPVQVHRRLVRYKIAFADSLGNSQTVPYADDEQPNFAYFVYNGVPAWTGALRPYAYSGFSATAARTYSPALLESKPPFHLIANASDVSTSQGGNTTVYYATVVHRGIVHDHVQFRVRGIGSTTVSGKNKWNIYFNRSRDFQAYDNYNRPYKETWNNLLVNCNASPWASVHRGSAGVEEALCNRIYQLGGMASMNTFYFHFRVIDDAVETSPADQFAGDLWGLYMGLEPTEGNFLDERGLPDGNLYSIEGGGGDKKHQGATQPVDSSDWSSFSDMVAAAGTTEQWYRDNVDLDALYTFLALNRLTGNVDVRPGDNYRFYHRSSDNRWVIIPYDLDMQFIAAHHWGGTMDGVMVAGAPNVVRAIGRHANLAREFRNRCREILSLMASDGTAAGGQIGQLVDETARFVNPPGEPLTWADLDAAMWNLNPKTTGSLGANTGQSSHKGNFFRAYYLDGSRGAGGPTSTGSWIRSLSDPDADGFSDHGGMMRWFTDFATNTWPGGTWIRKAGAAGGSGTDPDANRQKGYGYKYLEWESLYGGWTDSVNSPAISPWTDYPNKPAASYSGAGGFPEHQLAFTSSAFSDPQGAGTYAAHEWRIAEIQAPGIPGYVAGTPFKYEIETVWSSGELTGPPGAFELPLGIAEAGRTYRVRVRHKDTTGNWSLWSDPVQFTATEAPPGALIHYWNFNTAAAPLVPTQTIGGGVLTVAGTYLSDTGQGFAALNARNGDPAGAHLRINNPLTPGTAVTAAIPTTGFTNIIVRYEARRSGQGAGTQTVSYTANGIDYTPFATLTIADDVPVVTTLDFRELAAADNNPLFGLKITFSQGSGGTAGNNRFDNLTVEADALPGQPEFIPGGDGGWNIASNWASAAVPDGEGALAIVNPPATVGRTVSITSPVTLGTLRVHNGAGAYLNKIAGGGITFHGGAETALIDTDGTGAGLVEIEPAAGATLATDLRLAVANTVGDPAHGALRLRGIWDGPGGLVKQGSGTASLTGAGKDFAGALSVEQGVLQITQPATPGLTSGVTVQSGAQLRLISPNDINGPRTHVFGGTLALGGTLSYQPDTGGTNRAIVTNTLATTAAATAHIPGATDTLELSGILAGSSSLAKTGSGTLVLSGSSPAFTGGIAVAAGTLVVTGNLPQAPVHLAAGTLLAGSGTTGPITGAGTVSPETSVLTAASSAAAGYTFVFGRTGHADNGMLRLTAAIPFPAAPQTVDFFLAPAVRHPGDRFAGGFFATGSGALATALSGASVRILVADPAGTILHGGATYRGALPADNLSWQVVTRAVDFGSGPVSGQLVEIATGGQPTLYTQWRNLHFADPADAANDALSGPNATPSGDGVPNLIRYALGIGPAEPAAGLLPKLVSSGNGFVYRFRYDPARTDLRYRVRASSDLSGWPATIFDSSTGPIPPLDNGWLPVPLPQNLTGVQGMDPEMFVRLHVELAAP